MGDFDYEELSPGIRGAVRWFHKHGYETTDSGDGSLAADGMECAWPEPMIISVCPFWDMRSCADDLEELLDDLFTGSDADRPRVEASYACGEEAYLVTVGDSLLNW